MLCQGSHCYSLSVDEMLSPGLSQVFYTLCLTQVLFSPPVSPPSECPMHKAEAGPAHQDRAYEFVECPMKAAAGQNSDIDPTNMVTHHFSKWKEGFGP